jgi:hypothetical protein
MLRSIGSILGYDVRVTDGNLGRANDFYADDQFWIVRYLVIEGTGQLSGRQILISTTVLGQPRWSRRVVPVDLTTRQVTSSPRLQTPEPVVHEREDSLHDHYGWVPYRRPAEPLAGEAGLAATREISAIEREVDRREPGTHLRSIVELTGSHVQATDGSIGHVEDFLATDTRWIVRYLVADTVNLVPGKHVLLSPDWVIRADWTEQAISADLAQATVTDSPEYDPATPVNRAVEAHLYDYYGRPKYWTEP